MIYMYWATRWRDKFNEDIGSFKQRRFWAMQVNRKWTFTFLSGGFAQIFSQIVSVRVEEYKLYIVKACEEGKGLTSGWRPSLKNA